MGQRVVLKGRLLRPEPVEQRQPHVRPAKVAQVLATAHRWQRQVDAGEVEGQRGIAEREGITAARVSQVMGLLGLAPDVQEWVLGLVAVDGREPVVERELHAVARVWAWEGQRDQNSPFGPPGKR
jgi:hypothetical protein